MRRLIPAQRRHLIPAILALLIIVPLLTHPGRVAGKTLLLLPDMFPTSPVRPLTWITGAPRFEERSFDWPTGHIDADLYIPAGGGRHGALVLLLGAVGFPRRDPTLVRFADGLSRAGAVVLIPESTNLQNGDILPTEVEGLRLTAEYLRDRPEVDPQRVGFLGFSVGGSMALLAAESEHGRGQIAFVNAFGAYDDATDLLRSVASHTIVVDGRRIPWEPAELTVWVFMRQIIATLPDERDRDVLGRAFLDKQPEALDELDRLTPDGRLVVELFRQPTPERVDELVAALPAASRERLRDISPAPALDRLTARLYLMHDHSDSYIPFTHSRRLAADAPPGTLRAHTEFDLFAHVMPDRPLGGLDFAREVLKLYRHAWLFCQEFL